MTFLRSNTNHENNLRNGVDPRAEQQNQQQQQQQQQQQRRRWLMPKDNSLDYTVTRYRQNWSLVQKEGGERIIRAQTILEYEPPLGDESSTIQQHSMAIGLVDDTKSIQSILVTEMNVPTDVQYERVQENGIEYLRWSMDELVAPNEKSITFEVDYEITGAINQEGCETSEESAKISVCTESFEAPWANHWWNETLPLTIQNDIVYSFEIDGNDPKNDLSQYYDYDSLDLVEPSTSCCTFDAVVTRRNRTQTDASVVKYQGGYSSWEQRFKPSELGIGATTPNTVAFQWKVLRPNPCNSYFDHGSYGSSSFMLLLILILSMMSLFLVCSCMKCVYKKINPRLEPCYEDDDTFCSESTLSEYPNELNASDFLTTKDDGDENDL